MLRATQLQPHIQCNHTLDYTKVLRRLWAVSHKSIPRTEVLVFLTNRHENGRRAVTGVHKFDCFQLGAWYIFGAIWRMYWVHFSAYANFMTLAHVVTQTHTKTSRKIRNKTVRLEHNVFSIYMTVNIWSEAFFSLSPSFYLSLSLSLSFSLSLAYSMRISHIVMTLCIVTTYYYKLKISKTDQTKPNYPYIKKSIVSNVFQWCVKTRKIYQCDSYSCSNYRIRCNLY